MSVGDNGPGDLHEWVSFEDPKEDRTWVFDVTFLASNWTCIFGAGCQGVLTGPTPEREQGCCSYGAHFISEEDRESVIAAAARLQPHQWQFMANAKRGGFFRQNKDGEYMTRLAQGACIFLNRPGFAGGSGCALHRAALEAGEEPLTWKPDVCWQLPLRQQDNTDDQGHVTSTLREWKRRDWGKGGEDFHWWCTDSPEAFVGRTPVYKALAAEITEMVGETVYRMLADHLDGRSRRQFLPHPALRKR